ncbi:ABC transport system permease protein [Candidatus Kinetoplastibacterium desouzaii TCC079E]|uniref:Intermembrane phospholipid transport system permease protein MlaE n=1 Tax=Candidatus Kinetoplastidibacterium desouzai TCC079E TaxID=1208919 RepID=M1L1D7_9PROT|nr:lipid asymmetry maintenance ABC transporter permease subunit MlaE [Candidatus Kinetoplastibacterium desouzaii]AGF46593.1 ABC transport system permease protein [Candidatus Kinetoplastibacterium desouzaii TCC079E]
MTNIFIIGHWIYQYILNIGKFTCFLYRIISNIIIILKRPKLVLQQIYFIGNKSILIIVVAGVFIGFILGLQGYYTLSKYKSEDALGLTIALSLIRELSPVVTAILFAGRAGTSITAEIGLMKAEEQLIAMKIMAVDPVRRIITPRFFAGVISMPLLSSIFCTSGLMGGWYIGVFSGVDSGVFWSQIQHGIDIKGDILNSLLKSLIFGIISISISLYEGWQSKPTPEGVSESITRSVVNGYLSILGINFLLTAIMFKN